MTAKDGFFVGNVELGKADGTQIRFEGGELSRDSVIIVLCCIKNSPFTVYWP